MATPYVFDEHQSAFNVIHQDQWRRKVVLPNDMKPVQIEGWAHKHGKRKLQSWKKRYFRLFNNCIKYYAAEKTNAPKGIIDLSPYSTINVLRVGERRSKFASDDTSDESNRIVRRPHGIAILVPEIPRTFEIFFKNDKERDAWKNALAINLELILSETETIHRLVKAIRDAKVPDGQERESLAYNAGFSLVMLRLRHMVVKHTVQDDPFLAAYNSVTNGNLYELHTFMQSKRNLNVSQRSLDSKSTLALRAAQQNQPEVLVWLLERGCDPNIPNFQGDTPLHMASMLNALPCVRILLDYGAKRDAKNNFGETPEGQAALLGLSDVLDLLRNYAPASVLASSKALPGVNDYLCAQCMQVFELDPDAGDELWCEFCSMEMPRVAAEDVLESWKKFY